MTGSGTECVYSTLNTYTGPSTIKANWDPNTINLYWYNDDTQTSSNTCNYDGSISLPATNPTKTGYTFAGWEVLGGVPAGYTQLEYIRGTGTQYINTGYLGTSNSGVYFKYRYHTLDSSNGRILGVRVNSSTNAFAYVGTNSGTAVSTTTFYLSANNATAWSSGYNLNTNVHVVKSNINNDKKNYFDDVLVSTGTNSSYTHTQSLYIFGAYNNSSYSLGVKADVYILDIYESGVLVHRFLPAKRNSDSVVGMWDTFSKTFFTNAGSGTFTAGPAVQ